MIGNGAVEFKLVKQNPGLWGGLLFEANKAEIRDRREAAEDRSRARQAKAHESKLKAKQEAEREMVRKQMEVDSSEKRALEDIKESERQAASKELRILASAEPANAMSSTLPPTKKPVAKETRPMRTAGKITVTFTERAFKTPARDSHAAEEAEWLEKQTRARRAVQDAKKMCDDAGVDHDPLWLKDKGNEFFRKSDFVSAINAFTAAIALDPKNHAVFSNRAACHIAQGDFHAAGADCSKALSLLTPPVESNARSRLIAHSRRGAALAALGCPEMAIVDLREASKLDPTNTSISEDIAGLEQKIKQESGTTTANTTVPAEVAEGEDLD